MRLELTQTLQFSDERPGDYITGIVFSPDGSHFIATSRWSAVRVWKLPGNELVRSFQGGSESWSIALNRAGTLIGLGSDCGVQLWDPVTGNPVAPLEAMTDVSHMAFHPRSNVCAVAGSSISGQMVGLWDMDEGKVLKRRGYTHRIERIQFSPDGDVLAVNSAGRLYLLSIWGFQMEEALGGRRMQLHSVVLNEDWSQMISSHEQKAQLWSVVRENRDSFQYLSLEPRMELEFVGSFMPVYAFSPDARFVAYGKPMRVLDVEGQTISNALTDNDLLIGDSAFSPDGRLLVLGGSRTGHDAGLCEIQIWSVQP